MHWFSSEFYLLTPQIQAWMDNTFKMAPSMSACCHLTLNPLDSQLLFEAAESRARSSPSSKIIVARFVVRIESPICQRVKKGAYFGPNTAD